MTPSFEDLIRLYRTSESQQNSDVRSYMIKNEEDLILVNYLASDEQYKHTGLFLQNDNPQIGQKVAIQFNAPQPTFGRLYDDLAAFIRGDMALINQPNIQKSPYFIKDSNLASFDEPNSDLINYYLIRKLIQQLINMSAYTDIINNKLIFFSKKTFSLSIDVKECIQNFIQIVTELSKEDKAAIENFSQWLNDESTSTHIDEKKAILAYVLADTLNNNATIIEVLKQIEHISQAIQAQYALYLENFSYDKFIKKLDENKEKFIAKINDTITKLLPQFLSLPFLTAVPTALKSADNWIVYLALAIYCCICALALVHQKQLLDYLKYDIEHYSDNNSLPEQLLKKWEKEKARIKPLLNKQYFLFVILSITVILCFIYSIIQLVSLSS